MNGVAGLEHFPQKLQTFVIEKMLYFFQRKAISYRLGDATQAESALRARRLGPLWVCGLLALLCAQPSVTKADQVGTASGLAVPRYVSLKSDRVNLREGPAKDHRTTWIFQRAGLPVEITAEFETWRKVRDSEGSEGWVLHSLLSGRRTALVTPWKKAPKDSATSTLYQKPSDGASPTAMLQPGVLANIRSCDKTWCRVNGDGFDGFIHQADLWGVYPNEVIE